MLIILYLLVSFFWLAGMYAFMNAYKNDPRYWVKRYSWDSNVSWKDNIITITILGILFWPLMIPSIFIYKLAFEYFQKKAK